MLVDNINPEISCIVPTLNRAALLKEAIKSTLSQAYKNWEMIIVDDGSSDGTRGLVFEFIKKDARIKYFRNPGKGAGAARNFGIKNATGEWIAFLDDDVENLPNRFEDQLTAAKKSESNFILSGYKSISKQGKLIEHTSGFWGIGAPMTSCWFIKKDLLLLAGLFDESMPSMEETEFSYRIAKYEKFTNHLKAVTIEKSVANSLSKGFKALRGKEILIEKHKNNMPALEAAWWYYIIGTNY